MFRRLIETSPTWATLPLRLSLGLIFIGHGAQKVLGLWGGKGLAAFTAGNAPLGLRPAWLWLGMAAFSELIGGALVLLGLLTRLGALVIAGVMVVAMSGVHWGENMLPNFFLTNKGIEYTLALLGISLALMVIGGGKASIDERLGNHRGRRR
jgi:putative oxidoreductase